MTAHKSTNQVMVHSPRLVHERMTIFSHQNLSVPQKHVKPLVPALISEQTVIKIFRSLEV